MASITKRRTSYQVQVRRKDATPLSKCFKSLSDAKAWARQIEASIDKGSSPLASVRKASLPTLFAALARYALEVVPHKKGAAKDAARVRQWQQHPLAQKSIAIITPRDLSSYRDEELRRGRAPATVVRSLAVLSHLFSVATKDWGYMLDNPAMKMRKPRTNNARSRRPTLSELDAVLSNVSSPELRCFIRLAATTAMRRSELFGLRWDHVDLAGRKVFLADTKNGSSRFVLLSTQAVSIFKELQPAPHGRVFKFTHIDTPSTAFARAVERSRASYEAQCQADGVPALQGHLTDLRLHDMRHEATSAFFERGLSSMEVASITGHKTLAMLQRYTHLRAEHVLSKLG